MKYPPRPLSPDDCRRMLAACKKPRDRAMIVLLWRAGLRCAEACAVRWGDFEPSGSAARLHIPNGKGGKARFVGLDAKSMKIIHESGGIEYVLETRSGRALETSHVRRRLKIIAKTAGITGRVHAHGFRHAFARDLHNEGYSVREISVALGHTSLATTTAYLLSIGCAEVVEETMRREW